MAASPIQPETARSGRPIGVWIAGVLPTLWLATGAYTLGRILTDAFLREATENQFIINIALTWALLAFAIVQMFRLRSTALYAFAALALHQVYLLIVGLTAGPVPMAVPIQSVLLIVYGSVTFYLYRLRSRGALR